jgi:hypothetical protein
MHAIRKNSKAKQPESAESLRSLVAYIGGDATTLYNSSTLQPMSSSAVRQYLEEVGRTDQVCLFCGWVDSFL